MIILIIDCYGFKHVPSCRIQPLTGWGGGGWGWGESPKSKGRPTPTYGGVDFLRFRDGKNLGHAFVGIYYKHSPKISIARIGESRGWGSKNRNSVTQEYREKGLHLNRNENVHF